MNRATLIIAAVIWCTYSSAQTFTNVAPDFDIDAIVENNEFGSGMSFYDFNQDGWDDLSFTQRSAPCKFYVNNEGTFEEVDSFIYGYGQTKQLLWVDYDNDGDKDIFITADESPYFLYENDGDFNFTNVASSAGLAFNFECTFGAAFGDYDKDGFLDLYICTYENEGSEDEYEKLNHLYHNNGDGTFTDVTEDAGVGNGIKLSFGCVWIDYNKDGWQDLYVINDTNYANTLYKNNGDGTFSDVSISSSSGIAVDAINAAIGDFNNDTHLDMYITNSPGGNRLLKNNGNSTFSDISDDAGDILDAYSWGALWIDYNNNGWNDLYVTTYNPLNPDQQNHFYSNNGDETFTEFPDPFSGDHIADSMCPTKGDIDNDGSPDIAVHNKAPYTPFLWQNSGANNNYLKVTLEGTISNRDGIGSWVEVYCGDNVFTQYTACGEGYLGQSSQHVLFGIGQHSQVDSMKVTWLSGIVDVLYDVDSNQSIYLLEGETIQAQVEYSIDPPEICFGDSLTLSVGQWENYLWSTGDTTASITVGSPGEYYVTVDGMGLEIMSDTVSVIINPPPALNAQVQDVSCIDSTDGEAFILNNSGNGIAELIWAHDSTAGNPALNLSTGYYGYEVTDENGCTSSDIVYIDQPEEIVIELEVSHQIENNSGTAIITDIAGGTPPYSTHWSNGIENQMEINNLTLGEYSVTVTDSLGCTLHQPFFIDSITGINEELGSTFNIYPNPVDAGVFIQGPVGTYVLQIYDPSGRMIFEDHITLNENGKTFKKMKPLSTGFYVLRLGNETFSVTKRLLKN